MMSAEWAAASEILAMIAGFIANSELNEQAIDGLTPDGNSIRVSIRRARADGPGNSGSYNVKVYTTMETGVCRVTLTMRTYR